MSGRDLQRARKSAARQRDDAYTRKALRVAELEAALRDLRFTARILLQNAEGCAAAHHGRDFKADGAPGWLEDSRKVIERAEAALASEQ